MSARWILQRLEKQARNELVRRIGAAYIVVATFLVIFLLLTSNGRFVLHEQLNEPYWAGVIALILVLPLIVVPVIKYLWPRLTGIKIYNVLELSLTPKVTDNFARKFHEIVDPGSDVALYSMRMRDSSDQIIELIKELERSKRNDALVINLKRGREWIAPNLYFLAFLIARHPLVDQIVFVETGLKDNQFIAMCSPDELVTGLEMMFPEYAYAGQKFQEREKDPKGLSMGSPARVFFETLEEEWNKPGSRENNRIWLNSRIIAVLVGNYLHTQHLEKKEQLTEIDYRYIINSRYPYTAIVDDNKFSGLIDQRNLALRIARAMMD